MSQRFSEILRSYFKCKTEARIIKVRIERGRIIRDGNNITGLRILSSVNGDAIISSH